MSNLFGREPAVILGLVQVTIALFVAFGMELSNEQTGAILAFTGALLAVITRQSVYAPAKVLEVMPGTRPALGDADRPPAGTGDGRG